MLSTSFMFADRFRFLALGLIGYRSLLPDGQIACTCACLVVVVVMAAIVLQRGHNSQDSRYPQNPIYYSTFSNHIGF